MQSGYAYPSLAGHKLHYQGRWHWVFEISSKNLHAALVVRLQASEVYARLNNERSKAAGICRCCGAPVKADGKYQ